MTLFREVDWTVHQGGQITEVAAGSAAAAAGVQPGDELLAIDDQPVSDVIDVQFYTAEESFELVLRRDGEIVHRPVQRHYNQELGLSFAHLTFDVDIRRCNNLCEFCFVLQMAPKFRRTLYIKDDDYRYSFLFGHFVTLTNLDDHDWWRIEHMRLSPLYVSVHVTDLAMRRRFLRNDNAPDIMDQLRWLAEKGIEVHTQLVIVPEFNDGAWLEQSIADLAELWPAVQSVSVVPVGLTRQHKYGMRPHTPAEAAAMLDYVAGLQPAYLERFDRRFVYPSDEWFLVADRPVPPLDYYDDTALEENGLGMVRRFLDEWDELEREIADWQEAGMPATRHRHATLVTGTLFAPTLRRTAQLLAEQTGFTLEVQAIVNQRLGASITAAGLLMAGDIAAQLSQVELGEVVVLPRVVFDHPDVVSLDDWTPADMAVKLNRPVVLADSMGDVWDALSGRAGLTFDP